jgi:hypothetical protein
MMPAPRDPTTTNKPLQFLSHEGSNLSARTNLYFVVPCRAKHSRTQNRPARVLKKAQVRFQLRIVRISLQSMPEKHTSQEAQRIGMACSLAPNDETVEFESDMAWGRRAPDEKRFPPTSVRATPRTRIHIDTEDLVAIFTGVALIIAVYGVFIQGTVPIEKAANPVVGLASFGGVVQLVKARRESRGKTPALIWVVLGLLVVSLALNALLAIRVFGLI